MKLEFGFPSTKYQESTLKYNITLTELTLNSFQPSAAFHIETSHLMQIK